MAVTENFFTGDGSTTSYVLTFEYIDEDDVKVSLDGSTTTAYSFANATTILFDSAPASDVEIRIYRDTDIDDLKSTFFAGSSIRAQDLNQNFEQNNFAVQEIKNYTWDNETDTIHSDETWVSSDTQIATTAAMDARFQDEATETIESTETWVSDDNRVPTTLASDNRVDSKIDAAITGDIGTDGTGITVTDDGDGTITLGLGSGSIDLDRLKAEDVITQAEQNADYDLAGDDDSIFTSSASIRRFENYVQNSAPSGTGIGTGRVWVDVDDDLTLSVWNGSSWVGITSGGTFTNQPKVVYVDASSGDDDNDGHRISRPKQTIKAAVEQINADATYGDGSIVSVAPGIYAETLPIDIEKNDVGIIGQSLRTCIIHPKIPAVDHAGYDVNVPEAQELQTMFRVNSGSYFQNLTLTGLKASGTRGDTGSLYTDGTHGLPPNQGWNFAFYPNAVIKKSPYIQNCTNFSDSQVNNVNFTPHTPGEGAAGDLDSAPTGGGILIDGSVPASNSPLRSMVCDSYTHTALDGPGIFVTNNGYCQATSSYAFFNHAHITAINGGQANLAASTTDFGRFGLIADGKSATAIFTSNVDGAAADNDTTFSINAPAAAAGWYGSATRPQNNMLVTVNGVTYPVLSASSYTDSEGGAGWTVTISRPDPTDTSNNLGLNGAVSDDAAVSFFLRSMIASSGHTMEYVGSGTNYTALPENGGVPVDGNQIKELNDGKVWAATTDHKGTFKLGDFFTVDQQEGSLTVNSGSFKVDLSTLNVNVGGDAVVGADLDMGSNEITSSSGDLKLNATSNIDVQTNKIVNVVDPTSAQDAATKAYVDATAGTTVVNDLTPQLGGNLDVNGNTITSTSNANVVIDPNGTGTVDVSTSRITSVTDPTGAQDAATKNYVDTAVTNVVKTTDTGTVSTTMIADDAVTADKLADTTVTAGSYTLSSITVDAQGRITAASSGTAGGADNITEGNTSVEVVDTGSDGHITFDTEGSERARIDSSGRLLVGTSSSNGKFYGSSAVNHFIQVETVNNYSQSWINHSSTNATFGPHLTIGRTRGTADGDATIVQNGDNLGQLSFQGADGTDCVAAAQINAYVDGTPGANDMPGRLVFSTTADGSASPTERLRIASNGQLSAVVPGNTTLYPGYMCRAWVNFNGTGTVAIRANGNVSSITDDGTGQYTLNFTTNMPDVNYALMGSVNRANGDTTINALSVTLNGTTPLATGTAAIIVTGQSVSGADRNHVMVAIFR